MKGLELVRKREDWWLIGYIWGSDDMTWHGTQSGEWVWHTFQRPN